MSLPVSIPTTLADVISILDEKDNLLAHKRRDLRSAVNAMARFAGCPPAAVPANVPQLRDILEKVQPAKFRISARRLSNIRSDLVKALTLAGVPVEPLRLEEPFSPSWQRLRDALPSINERNLTARFMRWCSGAGICPEAVSDETISVYFDALEQRSFVLRQSKHIQDLVRTWNASAEDIGDWPGTRLTPLLRREVIMLSLSAFPASFNTDLQLWLERIGGKDPLIDAPFRPLRPVSVDMHRINLQRSASILVHLGTPAGDVIDLAHLVQPEIAKSVFRFHLDRKNGRPSQQTHLLGASLLAVARHWVKLEKAEQEALENVCRKCRVRPRGMTPKNRETLRTFDERLTRRLLQLPVKLMRRSTSKPEVSQRDAYRAAVALAVAILTVAPIRIENLSSIEVDRHIIRTTWGGKTEVLLWFPAHEVKNDQDIELPLDADTIKLLDTYLKRAWPVLAAPGCRALFPGRNGQRRHKGGLGETISRTVERELGVRVTPHQFRHLTGYLFLRENPGEHEVVRCLLGHKSLDTTVRFYAGMETDAAARRYQEIVLAPHRRGWKSNVRPTPKKPSSTMQSPVKS